MLFRSVIEFGPLEGCQTAGMVKNGVQSVTCIEARPDNFIKTLVAKTALGWQNVNLVMDDLHNVDVSKYGRFDLAFAHGVYYHSIAPFLFLENLIRLSENILIGGYCATPAWPVGEFEYLEHSGSRYRVKRYEELDYFMNGVNGFSYYFDRDDLLRFFLERNFDVTIIYDGPELVGGAGHTFLRFLARRKQAGSEMLSPSGQESLSK